MLSSLERYCPNKSEGCEWTGKSEQVKGHYKTCTKKSRGSIAREMEEKDILIALLKGKISASNQKYALLEETNMLLKDENEKLTKQIQVYDAFFNHDNKKTHNNANDGGCMDGMIADEKLSSPPPPSSSSHSPRNSDASNLAKLRQYEKKSVYL
jgi:hypothetical protein